MISVCLRRHRSTFARLAITASGLALIAVPAAAQRTDPASQEERESEDDDELSPAEIVVKGQAIRSNNGAFSTTRFDNDDIRERRVTEVEELFREVPGMNVRDYNLSGVANQIVIRGFGNGAHGGDLGMVIDGIPLNEANSHADGYSDSNILIPLEISDLTVYRGPVSALYGNFNRGGLIAFETRKGGSYADADVSVGNFDTFDVQGAVGVDNVDPGEFNGAVQYFRTDGFRPQSDAERFTVAGRYGIDITDRFELSVAGRYQAAEGVSPAYLTFDQFQTDPYGIDPRVQNDGSRKRFGTFRADLAYSLSSDVRLLGFAYTTQQSFSRFFTRGPADPNALWRQREETYDRDVYGGGVNLNGRTQIGSTDLSYVFGIEKFTEDTQFQFYDDLDFRQRTAPAQFDRTLGLDSTSAFGQVDVGFDPLLQLSLGLRYDYFTGDCDPDGIEIPGGACGEFEAIDSFSPKVGLRSQILPWLQLRASYSQGFSLPEAQAKFQTGAQGLDPNRIEQYEIGARLSPFDRFNIDVVGYRVDSSNEFASPAPGEFINFGETRREGIEASVTFAPLDTLELRAVYAYAESEVRENINPALIGRSITGIPDNTLTLDAEWTPIPRLTLNASYRYVGEYATDRFNTVYAPNYDIFDIGASYEMDQLIGLPSRVYVNVDNVGDEVYASSFNSLGSIAAGTPRFVKVGLQLGF